MLVSPLPSILDTYNITMSSLRYKALRIIISFLILCSVSFIKVLPSSISRIIPIILQRGRPTFLFFHQILAAELDLKKFSSMVYSFCYFLNFFLSSPLIIIIINIWLISEFITPTIADGLSLESPGLFSAFWQISMLLFGWLLFLSSPVPVPILWWLYRVRHLHLVSPSFSCSIISFQFSCSV